MIDTLVHGAIAGLLLTTGSMAWAGECPPPCKQPGRLVCIDPGPNGHCEGTKPDKFTIKNTIKYELDGKIYTVNPETPEKK